MHDTALSNGELQSKQLRTVEKLRDNAGKLAVRLQEATLDVLSSLTPTLSRGSNFATEDLFYPTGTPDLQYVNDIKKGDLLPVYLNEWQLWNIRKRSRQLCYFNEFAICGVENRVNYVVGDGFTYAVNPLDPNSQGHREAAKLCQRIVDIFLEVNEMSEIEADTCRKIDTDGEALIRLFPDEQGICHLRFVNADHLRTLGGGDGVPRTSYGIITAENDIETRQAYCIVENPSVSWNPAVVSADEVVHIKNTPREAKRGCPVYFPVFSNLLRCEELLQSMTHMAKVRAKLALIRKLTGVTSDAAQALLARLTTLTARYPDQNQDINVELVPPGSVPTIPANMEIEAPHPNIGASDFVEVLQAELRGVASSLQMPEWMFTALADAKYSNAFVVESPALKSFRKLQKKLTNAFGNSRYKQRASLVWRQLRVAVAHGLLPAGVLKCVKVECKGPPLETRDKKAESDRAVSLVKERLSSRKQQVQELGYDPEETTEQIAQETIGERRPVADMKEVAAIQQQFYAGSLPKLAAIGLVRVVMGFTEEQAGILFPGEPNPPQQPAVLPGGSPNGNTIPSGGSDDIADTSSTNGNSGPTVPVPGPNSGQRTGGNPLATALGLSEQFELHLQEAGFTGTIRDKLGREYHFVDGVRVAGQTEPETPKETPLDTAVRKSEHRQAKELHDLAINAPHLLTDEHMKELPRLLGSVPVDELARMAPEFNKLIADKVKPEHLTALLKVFPIPQPVAALMQQTDNGKAYLSRLNELAGAKMERPQTEKKADSGDDLPPSFERERRASFRDESDSIGRERVAANKSGEYDSPTPAAKKSTQDELKELQQRTVELDAKLKQAKLKLLKGKLDEHEEGSKQADKLEKRIDKLEVKASVLPPPPPPPPPPVSKQPEFKTPLPAISDVTSVPTSKAARLKVASQVRDRLGEVKKQIAASVGHSGQLNDTPHTPEQKQLEKQVFAALEPLASGKEREGVQDLGPISDNRYAGYYRTAVDNLNKYAATLNQAPKSSDAPVSSNAAGGIAPARPGKQRGTSLAKGARIADRLKGSPAGPKVEVSDLSMHKMSVSAGLASYNNLTLSERDTLKNAIRNVTTKEEADKLAEYVRKVNEQRKGKPREQWEELKLEQ